MVGLNYVNSYYTAKSAVLCINVVEFIILLFRHPAAF